VRVTAAHTTATVRAGIVHLIPIVITYPSSLRWGCRFSDVLDRPPNRTDGALDHKSYIGRRKVPCRCRAPGRVLRPTLPGWGSDCDIRCASRPRYRD
jgi:hypothetical protein